MLKSPLLHFATLGIIAFFLYTWLKPEPRETIRVTSQTIEALAQQRESVTQMPLTETEMEGLITGHVEDEVLLREAYKRGFDKNDYRVRKRILNIMRSSLSEVVPEPSNGQLRAFYDAQKDRYRAPPSRSFEQVYFSFTNKAMPADSSAFIAKLNNTQDVSTLGEFTTQGTRVLRSSFEQTARRFGKPFTERVFSLPLNTWHGPLESYQGIHYVRVFATHEAEVAPFEQLESYLRQDYLMTKMRESQQRKVDNLRENYDVIIDNPEAVE